MVSGRWVGGSVVGWSVVGGFNKTHSKQSRLYADVSQSSRRFTLTSYAKQTVLGIALVDLLILRTALES